MRRSRPTARSPAAPRASRWSANRLARGSKATSPTATVACTSPLPRQHQAPGDMHSRTVTVNDRLQQGYRYDLVARAGRDFDPEFRPELTPQKMLRLGVFCGK